MAVKAERQFAGDVAARPRLPPDDGYAPLVATAVGAAFHVAVARWVAGGTERSLDEIVREVFGQVAAGFDRSARPDGS